MLVRSIGGGGTVPTAQRMGGAKALVDAGAAGVVAGVSSGRGAHLDGCLRRLC